jgi:hypothetical protein
MSLAGRKCAVVGALERSGGFDGSELWCCDYLRVSVASSISRTKSRPLVEIAGQSKLVSMGFCEP